MTTLLPAPDAGPSEWVLAGTGAFNAFAVGSLLPSGFSSYVRIFHPASQGGRAVRWAEVAAANGTKAHPEMQLKAITHSPDPYHLSQPGIFDEEPAVGTLPHAEAAALVRVLALHTTTPERCWFAIWHGFSDLPEATRRAPTFGTESREYHLLVGPIDAAARNDDRLAFGRSGFQSPNLWWPDDRTWCVATEIDLNTTYVGCDESCARDLLASGLEAAPVGLAAGIHAFSDSVNGSSPRPE